MNVPRGDLVPYTIQARNTLSVTLPNIDLIDELPPGFKYRSGSARLNGAAVEPISSGRTLRWPNLTFTANETKTLTLVLVVGSGVGEGQYTNLAWAVNNVGGQRRIECGPGHRAGDPRSHVSTAPTSSARYSTTATPTATRTKGSPGYRTFVLRPRGAGW